MTSGYIKCPCDIYEPGADGICLDTECGHDAHQHNAEVGDHEACLAQEGDKPGCYLPFEDTRPCCPEFAATGYAHTEICPAFEANDPASRVNWTPPAAS